MSMSEMQMKLFAEQAAARHRTPVATVTHPKGVIVPNNELLTDNIRNDPNYVPYCGPCDPMQRMRRNETGFHCPTCYAKTNWDLTPYNGNVDVQFDPEYVDPEWLKGHQANVEAMRKHEELHQQTYTTFKARTNAEYSISWQEDVGKKNTGVRDCGVCHSQFFGKKSRKRCVPCETKHRDAKEVKQRAEHPWGDVEARRERPRRVGDRFR